MSVKQTEGKSQLYMKDYPVMMTRPEIATALLIRKNTSKAMPIREVIQTVSTIRMTVGVEGILSALRGNSSLQTLKRAKSPMSL